jgi:hypothetical protein
MTKASNSKQRDAIIDANCNVSVIGILNLEVI